MDELLKVALKAAEQGRSYAFATIIDSTIKGTPQKSGAKMVVLEDGVLFGTIGGGRNELAAKNECLKAIKNKKSKVVVYDFFGGEGQSVCGGQIKVFIEPFNGKNKLVICGAGHISLPLSVIGKLLNFHVTIIDNRDEFLNSARFPHVDVLIKGTHAVELKKIKLNKSHFVMIVTQGNEYDYECLKIAVKKRCSYLGVISSKAKRIKFLKRLKAEGVYNNTHIQLKMPAGFDIGAQTPEEIAVSIMADMIASLRRNNLGSAKFNQEALS